ncbi:hypothetical protein [Calothrix sp. CCY 0018]|uniref:hypothetical protein n=1 Tax=Calothrix sp. CCY 0018 TaxID=3103864 RepID=UPI0039C673A9
MSKFFEILEKIRVRPGMYIGRASVSDLFHFLVGFKTALRELDIKSTEDEIDFHREFQPWLQKRYHVSTSNSWAKIIMLYCGSEKEGLDSFYKLLDEFKNRDKSLNKDLTISPNAKLFMESQNEAIMESNNDYSQQEQTSKVKYKSDF